MANPILRLAAHFMFERPARQQSAADLIASLENSGQVIASRMATASDTAANREVLRHIMGIERWGQRRLRVLLGEPAVQDDYDPYLPDASFSFDQQRELFRQTRQETINLAQQLAATDLAAGVKVLHNQFGDLGARGWLRYLNQHAQMESKRAK